MTLKSKPSAPLADVQPFSLSQWEKQRERWKALGFFQTPGWLGILCEAFAEFHNRSVLLRDHSGREVLLPLVENRKAPGLHTWLSLPYGTYGGPIPEKSTGGACWKLVETFLREQKFSAINLTLPPGVQAPDWEGYRIRSLTTQVLDLRVGFDRLRQQCFSTACQRAIRKAERGRVEVRTLDKENHLQPFLNLYERSMKRWGLSKGFPRRLFELLWAEPGARYWGAFAHERLVAAALVLSQNTHQYYWLGVMDEAAQHLRPNNLLFSRILEQSCRTGMEAFDLGNSEGLIGVFNFKKSFGPEVVTYPQLYQAGPLVQGYHRLRALLRGSAAER